MIDFTTPIGLFIVAVIFIAMLIVAMPLALYYYFRAQEIAPFFAKKKALEETIEKLNKNIQIGQEELKQLLDEKVKAESLIKDSQAAHKWLEDTSQKLEDLQIQTVRAKEEYELAKTSLEGKNLQLSEKQLELAELNKKLENSEKLLEENRQKFEMLIKEEEKLTTKIATLKVNESSLIADTGKLNQKLLDLKKEYNELVKEYDKIKVQNDELQKETRRLLALKEENDKAKIALEECKCKISKLENDEDTFKQSISKLKIAKSNIETENEGLAKRRDEQKAEVTKLKEESDTLRQENAKNLILKEANNLLAKDKIKASQELDELRNKVETAKIDIARSEAIKNNEANMWKDLERSVASIEKKPKESSNITDEEQILKLFKRGLDESGYSFSERTIKAFHTGLLCGGVSPLVILSGISGTGKSLLPELYTKAFGMNFLPVAVQPRWDSPQDVFGFYNHMEGRFKATELSRLLWQFDRFNNPQAQKKYPKEKWDTFPMSLILLDEMNLARVEYYFSELLSKLEIRNRIIDPNDSCTRIASEVELEYGASSVTSNDVVATMARRLFVDHNILFVGTMNEDESTQTLSSKVIDRANVLRFGTPESLPRQPDEKLFQKYCNNFISYQTWLNWRKPFGSDMPNLDEYIKHLKQALRNVDRGFGHRTERAIKQYVQLYPGKKQDALADQIEMKVLPKLNGIEVDLVRDKVIGPLKEVLDNIHDEDVNDALNQTIQSEVTFFSWKGVRR